MKHFPENSFHLRRKPQSNSVLLSSMLPTLVCKKAEVVSIPELIIREREMAKNGNVQMAPIASNITKKILSRRSNNSLDKTLKRISVVSSHNQRPKSRVNKTIVCINQPELSDENLNIPKPPSKQRRFRVKKLDEKYLRCPLPEMFRNNIKSPRQNNNLISQNLLKQSVPTQVLYFNSSASIKNGIAILNINNFYSISHNWKQNTNEKLSDQFKAILLNLSSNFSVVIKSEQIESKVQKILTEITGQNIDILAWINVQKSHSTNHKLYNLSNVLKILGAVSNVWIFEQTAATPREINKQIMLPVFEQSANVNLVLYKKQDKSELSKINHQQLQKLKRVDSKQVISFKQEQQINSQKSVQAKVIPNKQSQNYDVGDYKNKLIQYLKILKNQKKTTTQASINYLVGDLIKRNFKIFENLVNNQQHYEVEDCREDIKMELETQQQLKYEIEILSF